MHWPPWCIPDLERVRIVQLLPGDLLSLGGYAMLTAYSYMSLPYPVAFVLSIATMGIGGYILSKIYFYPMFKENLNPQIILIGTVALSIFIRNSILLVWGPNQQRFANPFGSTPIPWET
jgi:branched-chain amino acid transport system permease protein